MPRSDQRTVGTDVFVTGQLAGCTDSRRMQNRFVVSPLQQGQPDSPSESRKQWLDLCGDICGAEKEKTEQRWDDYSSLAKIRPQFEM